VKTRGLEGGLAVRLLTVIVAGGPPINVVVGLNAQRMPAGGVGQARLMVPLKLVGPFATMTKLVEVAPISTGFPGFKAVGVASVKAAAPIPVSVTDWGLPVALSLMAKEPERVPLATGENETLTAQLWFTARVLPTALQVFVWVKSPVVPVEICEMVKGSVPVLVMVTFWGALTVPTLWLENERLVGTTVTAVAAVTPAPVRVICCSVPATPPALSVMMMVSVLLPVESGVKPTYIVQ